MIMIIFAKSCATIQKEVVIFLLSPTLSRSRTYKNLILTFLQQVLRKKNLCMLILNILLLITFCAYYLPIGLAYLLPDFLIDWHCNLQTVNIANYLLTRLQRKYLQNFQVTLEKDAIDKADTQSRNISSGGWKPLARGIRLENYKRRRKIEKKKESDKQDKESADDRVDIETSDNLSYLSISKPDKAIKLEPLATGVS